MTWLTPHARGRRSRGFALTDLLTAAAALGIPAALTLPAILPPEYADLLAKARIVRAQADTAAMATAFSVFALHCGDVPGSADGGAWPGTAGGSTCAAALNGTGVAPLLTAVTDAHGIPAGPVFDIAPTPPEGWTYAFTRTGVGTLTVTAAGDGTTITRP